MLAAIYVTYINYCNYIQQLLVTYHPRMDFVQALDPSKLVLAGTVRIYVFALLLRMTIS